MTGYFIELKRLTLPWTVLIKESMVSVNIAVMIFPLKDWKHCPILLYVPYVATRKKWRSSTLYIAIQLRTNFYKTRFLGPLRMERIKSNLMAKTLGKRLLAMGPQTLPKI